MRIKLVFDTWLGDDDHLSTGPFHAGTSWPGEMWLYPDEIKELSEAIEEGNVPVFRVMLP
jgi:hypothetical protein